MANNKKLGLPGGPNEYVTHVSDLFSTEGYKRNSPDVNNPFNIIPSGNITMEGVDFPVMGTDNLGNSQMMTPGNNYEFPGDQVFEVPMAKTGGGLLDKTMKCNSCGWEWKAADGGADVSTCHKCGSSALPKAQFGNFGGVNTDILDTSGKPVYETINPGDSNYDAKYRETYNAGAFAFAPNPLDEMVMYAGVDYEKYPYYNDLSAEQRKYFNDDGAIGRGVRRAASTKRGLAEDTRDMVTGMLVQQPLAVLQVPQSLMVEGIEGLRGNDYSFKDALTFDTQRRPSQLYGFKTTEDMSWYNPKVISNFTLDVITDPLNVVGAGVADDVLKLGLKQRLKNTAVRNTAKARKAQEAIFSKYITPKEAAAARAERMLAQESKWQVNSNTYTKDKFKNINNNFKEVYANEVGKTPKTLGVNTSNKALVFKDNGLSAANQSRIAAHETGHFYRNMADEANEWNSFFDFSKLKNKTRRYLRGKSGAKSNIEKQTKGFNAEKRPPHGDEIRERAAQLKDYIAQKNDIPLNKNFIVTEAQLDDAIKNYVKDTGLDNSMTPMLNSLKDKKGFLNAINKYALGVTPLVLGAASQLEEVPVPEMQKGGSLPDAQWGTAVKAIGKQAAKYSDELASFLKNFLNNADNITSSEPIINNARKNLTQFINDPIRMNNPFGFQRIGDTQPLSDLSLLNPKNIDLTKGFDNYAEELSKRQREYGIKHTNENLSENFFKGKARISNQLNENITPFGKALDSGMEGTVYEFANYPEFVLKHARNYSPNRSDINLPLEAMSFRNNATAIPLKGQKIFDKFSNTEGAISIMDNLNKVGLDSPLKLSKRDAYADLLKRVRKMRDAGIQIDANNTSNIRFNKDKGVYDIFDLERGKGNPTYMKWIDQQLRTGKMIPDKGSQFDFMYGGGLPKAQGGIETEFPKFNLSNQNLNLDERANNLTVQDNIPSSQSLKVIPELYEDNYSVTGKQRLQPQTGNDMVSAYDEPDTYDKVTDILASPLTSLSYFLSGQDIPDSLPLGIPGRNPHDAIIDMFNPFAMAKYAVQSNKTFDNAEPLSFNSTTGGIDGMGEYTNAGFEALGAIPIVPAWLKYGKNLNSPITKTIKPTALAPVANTVKKTSNVVNDAWKVKPLPGLHLKSTMDNGAISKIIEPKTGRINTEQALAIIKKESGGLEKVDFIKKQFGDAIPKKIDYNEFRTIVQKSLVPLELKINPDGRADYGLENLGYGSFWTNGTSKNLESAGILENNALTISNRTQFGGGSSMHGNPDDTLGHVHFLRDVDNPQTLTVTQIQSDAFQGGYATMPKTKEAANKNIAQNEKHLENQKRIWNSAVQQPDSSWLYPDGSLIPDGIHKLGVQGQESINAMQRAEAANLSQKQLLQKNHQERYLQEIVNYAAQRGDLNKVRIPTMDTAAKVQRYTPTSLGPRKVKDLESVTAAWRPEGVYVKTEAGDELAQYKYEFRPTNGGPSSFKEITEEKFLSLKNEDAIKLKSNIPAYNSSQQSILKKYKNLPKIIKKLYGQDVITVTDAKGNTWYEFDIPKSFKSGTGEIKAFKEGGSLPKAQNAGEDVQNAQQDVQNRAVIFAEAPEYITHQYNIDTPIYDNEGNLIANYPSELETLYNNYNQSESEIEDINNKKIAEKKASSYLQFLIHEKDKMKRQHDAMYKEFQKNGYYEGLGNKSKLVEFQEKYQKLGDQIGQFTAQIYDREKDIDKKYNPQLEELYLKNSNAYTDFYDNERNSQIKNMDSTFYKEAQNLQRVYEKLQPNTNVEIVPIFRDPDTMREKVADLNKNDAMFLFGHSGSRLGGIPNTEIANIFQESNAENCYLGSCDFEENVEPYTNMVGKNVNYRPSGAWWGVNPSGSTIDEAMWSRVTDQKPTADDMGTAKIITPTLGVDYQTKKLKKGGGIEKYTMYKDYVNGIYTGDKKESIAQKNYDRLNRLHYREAKTNQMTPANYILSYLME